jgi:hypothetical protein
MMKLNSLTMKVLGAVLTLVLIATLFSIPTTTAYADDPYLDVNIPTSGGMTNKDLEAMYKHEITWLLSQDQVFKDSFELETDFQALIKLQVKRHGEAPFLDVALGSFDTTMVAAQSVQLAAAKVIGTGWGFDAQGHVYNHDAALQTVINARYSLRDAHYRMLTAIHLLHRSYAEWHHKILGVPWP